MTGLRAGALWAIGLVISATSLAAFAESYRALLDWAARHGLHGLWAVIFPAQIDTFVLVGELALVVGLADSWKHRDRVSAWCVTGLGLAASVSANIGHVTGHDWASRATAAVPPLAAAASLAVGLGVLKRVVARRTPGRRPVTESVTGKQQKRAPVRAPGSSRRPPVGAATEAAILAAMSRNPGATTGQLAQVAGVSDRTVRRVRARLAEPVST